MRILYFRRTWTTKRKSRTQNGKCIINTWLNVPFKIDSSFFNFKNEVYEYSWICNRSFCVLVVHPFGQRRWTNNPQDYLGVVRSPPKCPWGWFEHSLRPYQPPPILAKVRPPPWPKGMDEQPSRLFKSSLATLQMALGVVRVFLLGQTSSTPNMAKGWFNHIWGLLNHPATPMAKGGSM